MQIEIRKITEYCSEERVYASDGKLVEVRKIFTPRPGSINNTMKTRKRRIPGAAGDAEALTGG